MGPAACALSFPNLTLNFYGDNLDVQLIKDQIVRAMTLTPMLHAECCELNVAWKLWGVIMAYFFSSGSPAFFLVRVMTLTRDL